MSIFSQPFDPVAQIQALVMSETVSELKKVLGGLSSTDLAPAWDETLAALAEFEDGHVGFVLDAWSDFATPDLVAKLCADENLFTNPEALAWCYKLRTERPNKNLFPTDLSTKIVLNSLDHLRPDGDRTQPWLIYLCERAGAPFLFDLNKVVKKSQENQFLYDCLENDLSGQWGEERKVSHILYAIENAATGADVTLDNLFSTFLPHFADAFFDDVSVAFFDQLSKSQKFKDYFDRSRQSKNLTVRMVVGDDLDQIDDFDVHPFPSDHFPLKTTCSDIASFEHFALLHPHLDVLFDVLKKKEGASLARAVFFDEKSHACVWALAEKLTNRRSPWGASPNLAHMLCDVDQPWRDSFGNTFLHYLAAQINQSAKRSAKTNTNIQSLACFFHQTPLLIGAKNARGQTCLDLMANPNLYQDFVLPIKTIFEQTLLTLDNQKEMESKASSGRPKM